MITSEALTAEEALIDDRDEVRSSRLRVLLFRPSTSLAAAGCILIILAGIIGPLVAPYSPNVGSAATLLSPRSGHLLGTDEYGRDVLSRMLAGARVSVIVGVGSVLIALIVGTVLGMIAGIRQKVVGGVIMRVMDVILSFPVLLLGAVMAGITAGRHLSVGPIHLGQVFVVTLVISVVQIPVFARIARASVMTEMAQEYILAARASGATRRQLVFTHLIPNVQAPLVVQAAFGVGVDIVLEASLSFLGLGVQPPQASWGNIMSEGQAELLFGGWWLILFPTVAIALTALCFNVLGDGIRDMFDPRHLTSLSPARRLFARSSSRNRSGAAAAVSVTEIALTPTRAAALTTHTTAVAAAEVPEVPARAVLPHAVGSRSGAAPREAVLDVVSLSVEYRGGHAVKRAVQDVSFSVATGESVGIVGESGSGKSTVLRAITGLLPPTAEVFGTVRLEQEELTTARLRDLRGGSIGLVFQDPANALNPSIRVGTQLARVLRLHRSDIPRRNRKAEVARLLGRVGIDPAKGSNFPFEFSQGQMQRIMIAATCLAAQPKVILADEPTTSLDVTVEAQVLSLLSELRQSLDLSLVLVTHDLALVSKMCDRVIVMYAGTVVEEFGAADLLTGSRHPYTDLLLKSIPAFPSDGRRLEPVPPELRPAAPGAPGRCPFATRCPKHLGPVCDEVPIALAAGPDADQLVRCHRFGRAA
jgi:peptide/nickel transport system permease protein